MKQYKVIKDFGPAIKGDIFYDDDDAIILDAESVDENGRSSRAAFISNGMVQGLIDSGFIAEIDDEENPNTCIKDEACNYCSKLAACKHPSSDEPKAYAPKQLAPDKPNTSDIKAKFKSVMSAGIDEVIEATVDAIDDMYASKVKEIVDFCIEKKDQFKNDYEELTEQYNNGDVPPCVKTEADTVYFNLNKVLDKILEIANNE
jgi:hypothetical protein